MKILPVRKRLSKPLASVACLLSPNVQGIAAVPKAYRRLPADDWSKAKAGAAESPVP